MCELLISSEIVTQTLNKSSQTNVGTHNISHAYPPTRDSILNALQYKLSGIMV
jgi:hypothetical protein